MEYNAPLIIAVTWLAFIAMAFWESSVEGRKAWDKGKYGWEIKFAKNLSLTRYHFWLSWVMLPLLLILPLVIYGWNLKLFGILLSGYASGMIIEDFMWYVINPVVKLKEFWTSFSDYYPWIKIKGRKIIPLGYVLGILIAVLSWLLFWR